jgi:hypothetical protein
MSALQGRLYTSTDTGTATIDMIGRDVTTGDDPAVDVTSHMAAFELQEINADAADITGESEGVDLAYIGVASDYRTRVALGGGMADTSLYFGIATHGNWSTLNRAKFTIYIDVTGDGLDDYAVVNGWAVPPGQVATFGLDEYYLSKLIRLSDNALIDYRWINGMSPGTADSALFDNNVMFMVVPALRLGLTAGSAQISYRVESLAIEDGPTTEILTVDTSVRHDFNVAAPGFDFGSEFPHAEASGMSIPVTFDRTALQMAGSLGVLCFHFHNATGDRVHVLELSSTGEPRIVGAAFEGKPLVVTGENFDAGSRITVNGATVSTTNDQASPTTRLISRKAGKLIAPGATVELRVLKTDGGVTAPFEYTRPGG